MYQDLYGFEIGCDSSDAAAAFTQGMAAAMSFDHSGIPELEAAVEADPDFAMAHALLARQRMIYGDVASMAEPIAAASQGLDRGTPRERSALAVMLGALQAKPRVVDIALEHVDAFPGDALILMHVVGPFGLLAFSGDRHWQENNALLVAGVKQHYPEDDWWISAIAAFNAGEVGETSAALELAERAWSLRQNGHTAHAMAHVQIEASAFAAGAAFLDDWLRQHSRSSDLGHHLVWHRSLLTLETAGPDGLLEAVTAQFADTNGNAPPIDLLADTVSLLWRLTLLDVEIPVAHWQRAAAVAEKHFPDAGFGFADVHRALVAAQQEVASRAELMEALQAHSTGYMVALAKGANAFADRSYSKAVALLEPVLTEMIQVGGSNPQRAIVRLIHDEAARRANSDRP